MKKEQKIVTYTCDICTKEMVPWEVTESRNTACVSITTEVWYGGLDEHKDICETCSSILYKTVQELKKGLTL